MKSTLAITSALSMICALPAVAEITSHNFKVIGTWGNLDSWQSLEQQFWAEDLPEATSGALTAEVIPITEAGLKGTEVMRLVKQGVFEVAHGLGSYVASENPAIEGVDLSSIAPDFATMHAIADAYKPEMDRIFQETYGARILSLHPWPASMIYCRGPVSGISDLAGKKIRVHSATLGDFVEGAGGVTVTLPFAEVVPALEKGVADCAITDPVSAYKASWQEVVDYVFALPVGYSITFTAINNSVWDKLDEGSRTALSDALAEMEAKGWQQAEANQATGVACLTGQGKCPWGEPGKAALATPSSEDEAARQNILSEFVLKRWGERCGADCADTWNATAGKAAGLSVPKP